MGRIAIGVVLCGFCFQLMGCKSLSGIEDGGKITKVKKYHLDLKNITKARAADPMIRNERKRRLHGAVWAEEREAIEGFYFSVFWKTESPDVPATVRLEYLLQETEDQVHIQEVEVSAGKRSHVTDFMVVGEEYADFGEVLAYRFTVEQEGRTIADHLSYLWE